MKRLLPLAVSAGLAAGVIAAEDAADPSAVPVRDSEGGSVERYRFRADLDRDGRQDLAVSLPVPTFGQAGGNFVLYVARPEGGYDRVGEVFLSPGAISVEAVDAAVKLWTHGRVSGSEGRLGYYVLSDDPSGGGAIVLSDFEDLTIHPGDGGTELGRALVSTVFSDPHRVQVERSETDTQRVRWSPWPPAPAKASSH